MRIGHVLAIDLVGYSLLLITEQTRLMNALTQLVQDTQRFRRAKEQGKLMRIPTGDGMCLVFFDDPQAPVECAVELAQALQAHPDIRVRMGMHSGPVNELVDVSGQPNLAGAGLDVTERVMSCGDAGHILLSKRMADDLAPFPQWNPHLHELGECEIKHGRRIALVNYFDGVVGNAAPPNSCAVQAKNAGTAEASSRARRRRALFALFVVLVLAGAVLFFMRGKRAVENTDAQAPGNSVAVLPFENASGDPSTDYLAEGIAEALINSLAEMPQLRVVARATAFHYKGKSVDPAGAGRDLKVKAVLTGKVRQVQDALSVQVDLVDVASGRQLWGAAYDRTLSDAVAVKQTIAREVADKLKGRLSGEEQQRLTRRDTANPQAYQLYLKGRYLWNKRARASLEESSRYFRQAIEADPTYALAHIGLADAYNFLGAFGIAVLPPSDAMPKARAAALRALELDDSLAEGHASLGFVKIYYDWDRAGAEAEFQRAIALNPNYAPAHQWYSHLLMSSGRTDEAIANARRAVAIDPLSLPAGMNLGWQLYWARHYDAAIEQLRALLQADGDFEQARWGLGLAYEGKRLPEATREFAKAVEVSDGNLVYVAALGRAQASSGETQAALEIAARLEAEVRYVSPYWMATLYVALNNADTAFAYLEKAIEERSGGVVWLNVDPNLDPLRADPRFALLLRRISVRQ